MSTELVAHGGAQLVAKQRSATACEARVQRGRQHIRGHAFVNRRVNGPTTFTRIAHASVKLGQLWIGGQGIGCQVKQPTANYAAAAPHFGHIGQIKFVHVRLWLTQGSCLRILLAHVHARVGVLNNVQTLGICRHNSILNSVVNHFHKVSAAVWSAMQITLLRGAWHIFARGSDRNGSLAWRQRAEDWIKTFHTCLGSANHLAVTAIKTPYAARSSNVNIVNARLGQFLGATNVVLVITIAAVNQRVALGKVRCNFGDGLVHIRGWNHHPNAARRWKFGDHVLNAGRGNGALSGQCFHGIRGHIKGNNFMSGFH